MSRFHASSAFCLAIMHRWWIYALKLYPSLSIRTHFTHLATYSALSRNTFELGSAQKIASGRKGRIVL